MRDIYVASCDKNGGIYHYKMTDNGDVSFCEKTPLDSPMFLAEENKKMYVLLRAPFDSNESGMVTFDIDSSGALKARDGVLSTKGVCACHLWVENGEVYAVNYLSGSVIKLPDTVDTHLGKGPHPVRQTAPHTHFVRVTPDKKYVCATDLGLDSIFFYDLDMNRKFVLKVPEGYGARHIEFSKDGKYMYCVNELVSSVSVFRYDGENSALLDTYAALPSDFTEKNTAAAIRIDGEYLYVSNRGHNSVAVFKTDGEKLELKGFTPVGAGPRDINIFGDILVSTNEQDNNVTFFRIKDGTLTRLTTTIDNIADPLCVI